MTRQLVKRSLLVVGLVIATLSAQVAASTITGGVERASACGVSISPVNATFNSSYDGWHETYTATWSCISGHYGTIGFDFQWGDGSPLTSVGVCSGNCPQAGGSISGSASHTWPRDGTYTVCARAYFGPTYNMTGWTCTSATFRNGCPPSCRPVRSTATNLYRWQS